MEQKTNDNISEHIHDKQIPKFITIDNYEYTFKKRKVNFKFTYRCRKRKYGILIELDETNLIKIINKKENETISYIKVTKKEHSCKDNIINTSTSNIKIQT